MPKWANCFPGTFSPISGHDNCLGYRHVAQKEIEEAHHMKIAYKLHVEESVDVYRLPQKHHENGGRNEPTPQINLYGMS
jgi:hypothetical protein